MLAHLRGSEICLSGTGGSNRTSSAPSSANTTPGAVCGARQIDRADAGMRNRAAHERRMQHARQNEIGDELPVAGQQPAVLAPQQRASDERSLAVIAHSCTEIPDGDAAV